MYIIIKNCITEYLKKLNSQTQINEYLIIRLLIDYYGTLLKQSIITKKRELHIPNHWSRLDVT